MNSQRLSSIYFTLSWLYGLTVVSIIVALIGGMILLHNLTFVDKGTLAQQTNRDFGANLFLICCALAIVLFIAIITVEIHKHRIASRNIVKNIEIPLSYKVCRVAFFVVLSPILIILVIELLRSLR